MNIALQEMKVNFMLFLLAVTSPVYSQQIMVELMTTPPVSTVFVGQSQTIRATWKDANGGSLVLPPAGDYSWAVINGTITQRSDISCSVNWNSPGIGTVTYEMTTWNNYYYDDYQVTVSNGPPVPNATFNITPGCNATTVKRNGSVPLGVQWFWQTSASGTSIDLVAETITRTTSGPLFLRARLASAPFTWSSTSQSVGNITITTPPPAPASSTDGHAITGGSAQVNLSVSPVSQASSYQWFSTAVSGTPISGVAGTSYSPTVSETTSYYVEARNGPCSSLSRRKVTAFIYPAPSIDVTSDGWITMGKPVQLSVVGTFDSYQWRRNGVIIPDATSRIYETNIPGSYTVTVTKATAPAFTSTSRTISLALESQNLNYIVSNTILVSGKGPGDITSLSVDQLSQSTQYFDGLGRLTQTVVTQGSPNRLDIVQPTTYDEFGREAVRYLPYVDGSSGRFKNDFKGIEESYSTLSNPHFRFYQSAAEVAHDTRPYSVVTFEQSPLSRPLKEQGPGKDWDGPNSQFHVGHAYLVNVHGSSGEAERIIAWRLTENGTLSRATPLSGYIEPGGFYSSGQLSIKVTTDEGSHKVREYVDKQGRVILKKVQAAGTARAGEDSHWAQTYYIYDDLGNLVMVLPPEAVKALTQN